MRSKISIVVAMALTATIFNGCASKKLAVEPKEFTAIQQPQLFKKPIEYIYVDKIISKSDNLGHDRIGNFSLNVTIPKNSILADLPNFINMPVVVDPEVAGVFLPQMRFGGKAKDVLDEIASVTNTYWLYDNGVVKFVRTKTVTYTFPAFTPIKLMSTYNIGNNKKDPFDVDKVRNDIFDEVEATLASIMLTGEHLGESTVEYSLKESDNMQEEQEKKSLLENKAKQGDSLQKESLKEEYAESNKLEADEKSNRVENKKVNKNGIEKKSKKNKNENAKAKEKIHIEPVIKNVMDKKENLFNKTSHNSSKASNETSRNGKKESKAIATEESAVKTDAIKNNLKTGREMAKSIKNSIVKKYDGKTKPYSVLKEAGIVTVVVTRDKEAQVDNAIRSIVSQMLNNIVALNLYVLEVNDNALRNFTAKLTVTGTGKNYNANFQPSNDGTHTLQLVLDNFLNMGGVRRYTTDALLQYLTQNENGKILQETKLLMLPGMPSRIKATIDHPYLEPQQISVGGTDSQLSYQIKYVNDGLDIGVVSNVLGDTVLMSLGVSLNQYLGKETVQAGQLGVFDLPLQSPRLLNTTFRVPAGKVVLLGGMRKTIYKNKKSANFFVPQDDSKELRRNNVIVVATPSIIRIVEKRDGDDKSFFIGKMGKGE